MKNILMLFTLSLAFFTLALPTYAAQTINMATLGNVNVRIDGAAASDKLGNYGIETADINQNGIPDLLLTVQSGSYSGRTTVSSTYVIFDNILSTLSGTANTLDLSNTANWNIRYVGAVTGDSASYYPVTVSDIDGNGKNDLLISHLNADHGGVSNRGAVYYINDSLIDDYSGTGNVVDLATTTNFTTKYLGAAASDNFGGSIGATEDFDNDGKKDLLIAAANTDYNSRANSGSAYVIYNSLIDDYSGTGNIVNIDTNTNYSIRFDGAVAGNLIYSYLIPGTGDIDTDGKDDILLTSPYADYGGTDTGSIYLIYNSIIDDYSGTGNTVDLSSATKYNVRIDGSTDNAATFGYSVSSFVDINGDSSNDLMIADSATGYNSRNYSGSVYILYRSLLATLTGTGNTLDLATSTSYNIRFDGSDADSYFGYDNWAFDYNSDGLIDIIAENCCVDNSIFIIYNSLFSSLTGTGNTINMATESNYSIKYTGPANNQFDVVYTNVDLNGDGKIDIINNDALADNNSRANSGSNYIIYNFPHSFTNTNAYPTSNSIIYKGTISATNSTTNISGVQYQVNSNSLTSGWSSCTADDGSFNSTSEAYTCQTGALSNGSHTIYIRSYDTNTSYTARSRFGTKTVVIGDVKGVASSDSKPQIDRASDGENNSKVASAVGDSSTNGQNVKTIIDSRTFNFDAFLSSQNMDPKTFAAGKVGLMKVKIGGVVYWQVSNLQDIWYKAYPPAGSDKSPAKIVQSLQKKLSILSLSYLEGNLIPPGRPKARLNAKSFKLAYSANGITWRLLPTSVVDTKNRTVSALTKIGGYYMIVSR